MVLLPYHIKHYHIMLINILFSLGLDRLSGLLFLSFPLYTLSGCIGKVVASHAEVARSIPVLAETAPIYTMPEALMWYCP